MLAGSSLALLHGHPASPAVAAAALLAALLIHAGTNLQNDVGDFRRGADLRGRVGPPRATTQGWLSARAVQAAAAASFALALLPGAYLALRGGWPIVAVGLASIGAGAAYTAGPRPIAYSALGELFVFLFFGLVAVAGMYYLHAGTLDAAPLIGGAILGSLATAVLVVNNLRDIESDRRVGKNTLAVRRGPGFAAAEYAILIHAPFALTALLCAYEGSLLLLPLVLLPWAMRLAARVRREPRGAGLNRVLAATTLLGIAFALLLSIGAALAALAGR